MGNRKIAYKNMDGVYVLGTAISIAFVMVMSMAYFAMLAPVAPEENRLRTMYCNNFTVQWHPDRNPEQTGTCGAEGTSMAGMTDFFYKMKTPEAVCAIDPYAQHLQLTTGSRKNGDERRAELFVKQTDANFFKVFALQFVEGRPYTMEEMKASDDEAQPSPVVITRHAARQLFGTDENVIGREIHGHSSGTCVVKGLVENVSPIATLSFADVYVAYKIGTSEPENSAYIRYIGECTPVIVAHSASDLDAIRQECRDIEHRINQIYKELLGEGSKFSMAEPITPAQNILTSRDADSGSNNRMLWVILTFVILLLVPAVNMSGMVAWKMDGMLSELAVRKAFGASRRSLLRSVLLQNLRTTCIGGALGLALSWLVLMVGKAWIFKALLPTDNGVDFSEYTLPADVFFSPWIFLITFVACAVLNLVAAFIPVWYSLRQNIVSGIKGSSIRRMGVSVLAIELSLITLAAWFVIDPLVVDYTQTHGSQGYDADRYMTVKMDIDNNKLREFDENERLTRCYEKFEDVARIIRAQPEVEQACVAMSKELPGLNGIEGIYDIYNTVVCSTLEDTTRLCSMFRVDMNPVSRTLQTMGQQVIDGDLTIEDIDQHKYDDTHEMVISRSAALKIFGTEKAAGKHLVFYYFDHYDIDEQGQPNLDHLRLKRLRRHNTDGIEGGMRVRAVVSDIAPNVLHRDASVCYTHQNGGYNITQYTLVRLADGVSPSAFQKKMADMAPQLYTDYVSVLNTKTLKDMHHTLSVAANANMYLNSCFALFLIVNVLLGVGSSFWVLTRKRREEIGVRRSFGASRRRIVWGFVLHGLLLCIVGMVVGTAIFFLWQSPADLHLSPDAFYTKYLAPYVNHNTDWITTPWQHIAVILGIILCLLTTVVALSTAVPAWMATKEKPVEALKEE
ncbi:MAG: FtsX-like permease family protein [Bacteroidaceae bacterium]|nr:FtsX-like permease family protein [Bacteroidaceae bacterium]